MHTTNATIIRELRQKHGLSQEQLGEILGVKKSTIQKYENGGIQNVKLKTIKTLCEYFRVPPLFFIFGRVDIGENKYFDAILKAQYGENLFNTFLIIKKLNSEGLQKIVDYASDISCNPAYLKGDVNHGKSNGANI